MWFEVGESYENKLLIMQAVGVVQAKGVDPRIEQAKNYAVAQAQQDGCVGNFKIFDSPYGNFLVPVIPSRSELGG